MGKVLVFPIEGVSLLITFSSVKLFTILSFTVPTKVGLFWLFNTILPFTDVGTDFFTFLDLLRDGHVMWATLTFVVVWNPFFIHLLSCFHLPKENRIGQIFTSIPFILPIKNLYQTVVLASLGFGRPELDDLDWAKVELIQRDAGIAGMYESFTEAGPQSVIQLVVILCTGRISPAQWFSIPSSLFIVLNSILLWTLIGGLLGGYIFIGIPGCFATIFLSLYILEKTNKMRNKRKTGEALQQVKIAEDTPKKREDDQGHEKESSEPPSIEVTEQRETDADKENHKKITQTRFQQPLRRRAKISR